MTDWYTTTNASTSSAMNEAWAGMFAREAAFYWAPPAPVKLPPWGIGFALDFVECPPGVVRLSVASDDEQGLKDTVAMLNQAMCAAGPAKADKKRGAFVLVVPLVIAALANWRATVATRGSEHEPGDLRRLLAAPSAEVSP